MGGKSKKVTVGYKYYVGQHMAICHGPVDYIRTIRVDEKKLFVGQQGDGALQVNATELFGGEKREGGISGTIDFDFGKNTQLQNSYLRNKVSSLVPAYRGILSAILNQVYMGTNPYLKPWEFRVQRIHTRQSEGLVQWYDEKSEIAHATIFDYDGYWNYIVDDVAKAIGQPSEYTEENFDHSDWVYAQGGFGTQPYGGINNNTYVPSGLVGRGIWTRKIFTIEEPETAGDILIDIWRDDASWAWINGVQVFESQLSGYFHGQYVIPAHLIKHTNVLSVQVLDSIPGGSPLNIFSGMRISSSSGQWDMNPAHIIRECITDPDWGMGYLDVDVDDDSFRLSADTFYNENLGISILWDRQIKIEEFISEILRHCDAALYLDRTTGKFVLKPIRADYDEETILVLDESNIVGVKKYTRLSSDEVVNSVTVVYEQAGTGNSTTVIAEDIALISQYGSVNSTTIQYPGFSVFATAAMAAKRDLKSLSNRLLNATITTNRAASNLNVGDVFKFYWSDYHDDYVVMRVKQLGFGDGKKNTISIECIEDVFTTDTTPITTREYTEWTSPVDVPDDVSGVYAAEVPYYELVQTSGQTDVDSELVLDSTVGYLSVSTYMDITSGGYINGTYWVNSGGSYIENETIDFCPVGVMLANMDKQETTITFSIFLNFDDIAIGSQLVIDDEIMGVESVDTSTGDVTVSRGCVDTLPENHTSGSHVVFYSDYAESDEIQYNDSEVVNSKVTSITGAGEQLIDDATAHPITFNSRAIRPYPPGNLKVNTVLLGDTAIDSVDITWSHRDRLQQTASHFAYTTGNVGPEAGTTYNVVLKYSNGVVIDSATGLTGTSWSSIQPSIMSDLLTFELTAFRDGFESLQKYSFTIQYTDSSAYTPDEGFTVDSQAYTPSNNFTI